MHKLKGYISEGLFSFGSHAYENYEVTHLEFKSKASSRDLTRGIILAAIREDGFRLALAKHHEALLPKLEIWEGIEQTDRTKLMNINWQEFNDIGDAKKWKKIALAWRPDGEFLTDWPHWVPPGPGDIKRYLGLK